MKLIRPTTEADMVAVYLGAEIASKRWGQLILDLLERERQSRAVVDKPDITNRAENTCRKRLLEAYRSYVFKELPAEVAWHRALLTLEEVARVRYIDYDYWNELSSQTRLPRVAAETIRAGQEI
jgi:hypothetical protein